jgi:hypothetical protein
MKSGYAPGNARVRLCLLGLGRLPPEVQALGLLIAHFRDELSLLRRLVRDLSALTARSRPLRAYFQEA